MAPRGHHLIALIAIVCLEHRAALHLDAGRRGALRQWAVVQLRPPPLEVSPFVLQREEQKHPHEGRPRIQRRRQHVVVPLPPPLAVPEHEVVEDGARHQPARDVGGRGRRHPGEAVGDDGYVDQGDPLLLRVHLAEHPHRHRQHGADEEQPHQVAVEAAVAEEPAGADEPPDDGGVEGDPVQGLSGCSASTSHMFSMLSSIHHATERLTTPAMTVPASYMGTEKATSGRVLRLWSDGGLVPNARALQVFVRIHLSSVQAPRGNFHVVAELQIGEEGEGVDGADSPIDLEEQIGDGLPGQDVADHKLCNDVVSRLLFIRVKNKVELSRSTHCWTRNPKGTFKIKSFSDMEYMWEEMSELNVKPRNTCKRFGFIPEERYLCKVRRPPHFNWLHQISPQHSCPSIAQYLQD
ncbi:hypothetical protein Taro_047134 [Colocasia esculenta]|uniref:Uncharacterized protein n=1 Tax=Colocasia esculenta TaxID=4460 RepID=A0A843X6D1_COLES|nr:hypothetical protein [Colocasia esculenta]